MQVKARVQAIHFANDKEVTVQFQGVGNNASFSVNQPRDVAKELQVGETGTLSWEPDEEE